MDEKNLQQLENEEVEVAVEEPEAVLSEEEAMSEDAKLIESLRAEIRVLEEKEAILAEKLCLVKDKGMSEKTDKCRALLQKLVRHKNRKLAELEVVEARYRQAEAKKMVERLSEEVDTLTEEIENEVLPSEEIELEVEPLYEAKYDHLAKSRRLSVIAKAFAFVGILAGLVGALIYSLLAVGAYVAFEPMAYVVFGGVAVVMIVIGLIVGGVSNHHKRLAADIELEIAEKRAAYEAAVAERERLAAEENAPWKLENLDAVTQAYAIEQRGDVKRATKKALKKMIPDLEDENVKKTIHKVAPVAAACATVAVVALVASGKKASAAKKNAAVRKELLDLLINS